MKRFGFVATLISVLALASSACAIEVTLFERTYTRSTGRSDIWNDPFPGVAGTGKLIIVNGGETDNQRITSGRVWVNGNQILGPNDFKRNLLSSDNRVDLLEDNSITVELSSKPGTWITVKVLQEIEGAAAAVVGPEGGVVKVNTQQSPISGAGITLPPGALLEAKLISLREWQNIPPLPGGWSPAGRGLFYKPEKTSFEMPCILSLPIDTPPLPDQFLAVAYYNHATSQWMALPVCRYNGAEGIAEAYSTHFSGYIAVKLRRNPMPESVSTDFNPSIDSLNYDNNNFQFCPEENAGVCNGIAIYAKWYYQNHGHGLYCVYDENKAQQIACKVFKEYDKLMGAGSFTKWYSWFLWLKLKESVTSGKAGGLKYVNRSKRW